ncbi:hypothetical protein [Iodidimonas sp. SYSU 1G8]|uniref:hypothetical protein n=1 Tax=Iodidimonas sp. SYSU 1G8 TaxID=3133967 RepID=UPI0031FEEF07
MSSVIEKLIESWLDSQTERRYQPAFVQLLIAEGWRVLHNTRHSPIEFGKDIIARDPKGDLYCIQLKGDPGGRLRKSAATSIIPQLIELIEIAPAQDFLVSSDERYISVLVTNGEIDEEARLILGNLASRTEQERCPSVRFEIWSRGDLLARFISASKSIWPTTPEGMRRILALFTSNGEGTPSPRDISGALSLISSRPQEIKESQTSIDSFLNKTILLVEIIKNPWLQRNNHFSLFVISVISSMYILGSCRSEKDIRRVEQYATSCLVHIKDLIEEARDKNYDPGLSWVQKNIFSDYEIMWERRNIIGLCAAVLVLSSSTIMRKDSEYIKSLLIESLKDPQIWGAACIPSIIIRYWASCRLKADLEPESIFIQIVNTIFCLNVHKKTYFPALPSPYYDFVDCWAYHHDIRYFGENKIWDDDFSNRMWFGRAVMFILAKRNWKQTCKRLWSRFSRISHEEPEFTSNNFFDPSYHNEGKIETYMFHEGGWDALVNSAIDSGIEPQLDRLGKLSWLVAAYIALVPYRGSTTLIMWLDSELNSTWYNDFHRPSS